MKHTNPEIQKVTAYIDGSCLGNPGPGGWGVVLIYGDHTKEIYGSEQQTTNNRMELMAAVQAFLNLRRSVDVTVITDSLYLLNGMTKWLEGWKRANWHPKGRSPIKNRDLWQQLDKLVTKHTTHWQWVKGHSGDPGNELADDLALRGAKGAQQAAIL